mgnify:CR=1 FL=1
MRSTTVGNDHVPTDRQSTPVREVGSSPSVTAATASSLPPQRETWQSYRQPCLRRSIADSATFLTDSRKSWPHPAGVVRPSNKNVGGKAGGARAVTIRSNTVVSSTT